ncbi:MAG: SPOR domain-containing protein [Deltaproteobacteria bacterium]|nr:SPOR domain-containing protein [Deltaproteobacteria bacterium]
MSIVESFSKRTIILLVALVVIGGVAAAYLLYFREAGIAPAPEPEKIAKRIKIEAPPPPEAKKEVAPGGGQQAPSAQQGAVKPVETKPEVKKKEETKPAVKEVVTGKKAEVKKEKPAPHKKMAYKSWAVHVASYTSKEEALAMVKQLRQDNYNAYMTEFNLKGKQWYRVRVGFYASEREAKAEGKKISDRHHMNGIWTVKPAKKEIMSHLN